MYHAQVILEDSTVEFMYHTLYPMGELLYFFFDENGYKFQAFNTKSIKQVISEKVSVK